MLLKQKLWEKLSMPNIHQVMTISISTLLFFDFYVSNAPNTAIVSIKHPKFSLLTPYNNQIRYPVEDAYDTLLDIKNFSFLINPGPCRNTSLLLIIIVSSKPTNYKNRKVIRNTWGKATNSLRVLFLVGISNKYNVTAAIDSESQLYGDIVKGSFVDAYRNMTYKHAMGLKWVTHHCPTAKYILKTDDDIVVNIFRLRNFLARKLSPWGAKGLITCRVLSNAAVLRSSSFSKWAVSEDEYYEDFYPPYCAGWAILYSQDVVPWLLEAVQEIPYFWIDDVQISGIAANLIGVERTSLASLLITNKERLRPRYDINYFLMGPPDCDTNQMISIWQSISSANVLGRKKLTW